LISSADVLGNSSHAGWVSAESGWYPDPGNADSIRWWTGADWTPYTLPSFAFALAEVPSAVVAVLPEEPAVVPQEPAVLPEAPAVLQEEPVALEPFTDGPIRVAPAAPERQRRAAAVPRQPTAATSPQKVIESLPKQADGKPLAAPSTVTLLPESDDAPPPQQRRRLRRSK
jgi:hypothetical protein